MPELLQTDGNYEAYLAQLFNPLAGGQFTQGLNPMGTGIGGLGAGTLPNMAGLLQNPWATPYSQYPQQQFTQQFNQPWPQQATNPLVQQIAAKQALQAIQHAQAVQALKQLVHNLATQSAMNAQAQLGYGMGGIYGQIGQGIPQPYGQIGQGLPQPYGQLGQGVPQQQYGFAGQNPFNQQLQQQGLQQQMLQQQCLQQIAQYLASQQPTPFRYGLA